jgi:DNA adenine methylase
MRETTGGVPDESDIASFLPLSTMLEKEYEVSPGRGVNSGSWSAMNQLRALPLVTNWRSAIQTAQGSSLQSSANAIAGAVDPRAILSEKGISTCKDLNKLVLHGGVVRPFLKWVGGKAQIIDNITDMLPTQVDTYYEPFLGGGSVLLNTLYMHYSNKITINKRVIASDINEDLITLYRHVRDDVDTLLDEVKKLSSEYLSLRSMESKKECYYRVRDEYNCRLSDDEVANMPYDVLQRSRIRRSAMFIFLNKTCFRGMYRCAKKTGHFNVSFGNYAEPTFVCPKHLRGISLMIQPVVFVVSDFANILRHHESANTSPKDFIYMDPPYVKLNDNSFVNYSREGFSEEKHDTLFTLLKTLKSQFMFSNSYTEEVLSHFVDNPFIIVVIPAFRRINSKAPNQKMDEVVVVNYNTTH